MNGRLKAPIGLAVAMWLALVGGEFALAQGGTEAPRPEETGATAEDGAAEGSARAEGRGRVIGRVTYEGRVARAWMAPETVWTPPTASLEAEVDPSAAPSPPAIQITKDGGIRETAVWLESEAAKQALRGMELPVVEVDQRGSVFFPMMVVMPKGGKLVLKNSDGINHNVHLLSHRQEKNFLLRSQEEREVKLNHEDAIRVTCDLHAWMRSSLVVVESPYYAVTDAEGDFAIENVPAGRYQIKIGHHRFKHEPKVIEIEVKAGETTEAPIRTALGTWDH